jgi:hypothetical protein
LVFQVPKESEFLVKESGMKAIIDGKQYDTATAKEIEKKFVTGMSREAI